MGALSGRDSNVSIYLNLNKQYYISGETVEGEVYLDVKAPRPYSSLILFLLGEQSVMWTEHHDKHTYVFSNSCQNYRGQTVITDFNGGLPQGQYVFPFRFALPTMITGSFYIDSTCFLRYVLKAVLVHPTDARDSQSYDMFLNILEPPRMPLSQVGLTNSQQSKCCGCCCSYGTTTVSLTSDRNFLKNGDVINIKGLINNRNGTKKVKSAEVVLEQWLLQISREYRTNYTKQKYFTLHRLDVPTQPGQQQQFNANVTIPNQIVECTAIGRIVARYFVLHLDTSYGCCANTAESILHVIFHSKTPLVVEKKKIEAPPSWNPKYFPRVDCMNMVPYNYTPLPMIPFLNLPGNNNPSVNMNFEKNMQNLQKAFSYDLNNQVVANNNHSFDYQPRYYNQDMFSKQQQIQQGYQPYFVSGNDVQTERELKQKKM